MILSLLFALCLTEKSASTPVHTSFSCSTPCKWTQWFNIHTPTELVDDGDFETLENIRAKGHQVCREPKDISCRSSRFPYIPFSELIHDVQCDKHNGLTCYNRGHYGACLDYEIQLLCCPCEETTEQPKPKIATVPTASSCTTPCKWTQWFNSYTPTEQMDDGDFEILDNIRAQGYQVCQEPKDVRCRSAQFHYIPFSELIHNIQCDKCTGLTCYNKDNYGRCLDYEIQLLCCSCGETTEQPEPRFTTVTPPYVNPVCSWSPWFNKHAPTAGPDGGDFETLNEIQAQGESVCHNPQAVNCRLSRFPYIPLDQLYYKQDCTVNNGLICFNSDQENDICLDYEIRFLCCS